MLRRQRAALRAEIRQLRRKEAALGCRHGGSSRRRRRQGPYAPERPCVGQRGEDREAGKAIAAAKKSNEQLQERNNEDVVDIPAGCGKSSASSTRTRRRFSTASSHRSPSSRRARRKRPGGDLAAARDCGVPRDAVPSRRPFAARRLQRALVRAEPARPERGARDLIAPVHPGRREGRHDHERNVLKQRVCAFVNRGFTEGGVGDLVAEGRAVRAGHAQRHGLVEEARGPCC